MAKEGSETSVWRPRRLPRAVAFSGERPCNLRGGPPNNWFSPWGAFLGGPGSAKVRQGSNVDGKTKLILTISFFAPSGFRKVPRESQERVRRPRRPPRRSLERGRGPKRSPRAAKMDRSSFVGPQGGPKSERASKRWLLENEVPQK